MILFASLLIACGDNTSSSSQQLNMKKNDCVKAELCELPDTESSYTGTKNVKHKFSANAGGERSFVVTFPKNYDSNLKSLYTTNFTEPLSYQDSAFLKLPKFP